MLDDSQTMVLDSFKEKWKPVMGDEFTGKSSRARFQRMKEAHGDAKNRIFVAAAAHGMVTRLGQHIGQSAAEAEHQRSSPAEAVVLRAKIAELMEQERDEKQNYFYHHPTPGWRMPKPLVQIGQRPPVTLTPASSSTGQPSQTYTAGEVTLNDNSEATLPDP